MPDGSVAADEAETRQVTFRGNRSRRPDARPVAPLVAKARPRQVVAPLSTPRTQTAFSLKFVAQFEEKANVLEETGTGTTGLLVVLAVIYIVRGLWDRN